MRLLDLFSGIGGFSLAAKWTWGDELDIVGFCEIDKFCQKVLTKNFLGVPIYDDIKKLKGSQFRSVDIITGGFPCQGFSVAGKRKGKEDDRYLWPEMFRVIQEAKPRWVIGENVTGIIDMALDTVLFDLENERYETQTFIIPACSQNAPHKRERVWIVANSVRTGAGDKTGKVGRQKRQPSKNGTSSIRQGNGEVGTGGIVSTGEVLAQSQANNASRRSEKICETNGGQDGEPLSEFSNPGDVANAQGKYSNVGNNNTGKLPQQKEVSEFRNRSRKNNVADTNKLNGNKPGFRTSETPQFETPRIFPMPDWITEPDVGRVVTRISPWMDGSINETSSGTEKILQALQETNDTEKIQWSFRGFVDIQTQKSLLLELCEYQGETKTLGNVSLESKETPEKILRSVWVNGLSTCPSCRRRAEKQRSREHPNALRILPQLLTCNCGSIRLDATGTPSEAPRVDRLKGLGNAIVPQVAAVIMSAIKEINETAKKD